MQHTYLSITQYLLVYHVYLCVIADVRGCAVFGVSSLIVTRNMWILFFFIIIEHFALTFFWLSLHAVFPPQSFQAALLMWRGPHSLRKAKLVKSPSSNYSHLPAWLPSAPSLLHKHRQTLKCLILCISPPNNHMSLRCSGPAKSSIIALAYAPLIKGEQYVKRITLQFSAEFCAILVTGRRKGCRGGGKKESAFLFLLTGSCECIFNEAVSRGMLDHNEALVRERTTSRQSSQDSWVLLHCFPLSHCWGLSQKYNDMTCFGHCQ